MKNVLITGGAGFIGSHLADLLLMRGYTVRVLDKLIPQVHEGNGGPYLSEHAELIVADICDKDSLSKALKGIEVVINLAAEVGVGQSMYEITRYVNANTGGTATLLELLASGKYDVKRLIQASSMSVYGEGAYECNDHGIVSPKLRSLEQLKKHEWEVVCTQCQNELTSLPTSEEKTLNPTSIYAISKLDQELMALSIGKAYGIGTVALRFFNVYGTRQALSNPYTGVAAIFTSQLLSGKRPIVFEDGKQTRDFIHVSDVVDAIVRSVEATNVTDTVFNVGSGKPISIYQVAEYLAQELKIELQPEISNKYRVGDIRHCWADVSKAKDLLGFTAKTDYREGIVELVEWSRRQISGSDTGAAMDELKTRGLTL